MDDEKMAEYVAKIIGAAEIGGDLSIKAIVTLIDEIREQGFIDGKHCMIDRLRMEMDKSDHRKMN